MKRARLIGWNIYFDPFRDINFIVETAVFQYVEVVRQVLLMRIRFVMLAFIK